MSDSKVFMFPDAGTSKSDLMSVIGPLLSQRGIDPNLLLMSRNNGMFGGEGGMFIWLLFLLIFTGYGNFGNFGNRVGLQNAAGTAYLGNLINNDSGRELLLQTIQGNRTAINELAQNLNCSIGDVQTSLNRMITGIQSVGSKVDMSVPQIINAIQAGDCSIASKLAECCCENRLSNCQQTNTLQNAINGVATGQERGFSSIAYETQKQTCQLQDSLKSATDAILAGQRDAEMREMQNKIDALRESNAHKDVVINNGQQTAVFSQMIQSATAPITSAVANLQNDINGIKCKLPETTTIPYSPVVGVPQCVAAQYGLVGCGNPYAAGFWG